MIPDTFRLLIDFGDWALLDGVGGIEVFLGGSSSVRGGGLRKDKTVSKWAIWEHICVRDLKSC